jgi:hypothetical protein|tara:strand:- start:887 stop:1654 length:768 start_codon:yes stop_codon:yes gene_type:complete
MYSTSKEELIDYCLRALGHPVVEVNIDEEQLDDRIDEALQWFRENHPDGSKRYYLKHQLTQTDIDNQYVDFGDDLDLTAVVRMVPVSLGGVGSGWFSDAWQVMAHTVTDFSNSSILGDLAHYEQIQQHLSLLDMKLGGQPQITFDRQYNRINLYVSKTHLQVDDFVLFEVYGIRNPDNSINEYNSLWNHKFLKEYSTALIKRQWGTNLIKFDGMTLPGGVTVNARLIYEDALADIDRLMEKFRNEEDEGPMFFIG